MFSLALLLPMLITTPPSAHAYAASFFEARCNSGAATASIPFNISQPDGFYFVDGQIQIHVGTEPNYGSFPAIVLSQATSPRFVRPGQWGEGAPNLFTLQSRYGKLGFILRTSTLDQVGTHDLVSVERFDSQGNSLGTQAAVCEVFPR